MRGVVSKTMKYLIEHGDMYLLWQVSVVRWSCIHMKFTKCYNTLSGTYKIQENMHDFVVLTVKIDLEVNNSIKSKLFLLYSRFNL